MKSSTIIFSILALALVGLGVFVIASRNGYVLILASSPQEHGPTDAEKLLHASDTRNVANHAIDEFVKSGGTWDAADARTANTTITDPAKMGVTAGGEVISFNIDRNPERSPGVRYNPDTQRYVVYGASSLTGKDDTASPDPSTDDQIARIVETPEQARQRVLAETTAQP